MEATIVDNKIVVKKKESGDEKIRKELIQYLKECINLPSGEYCTADFFDWLEKQGEQKPAWSEEDENGLGDTLWAIKQARTIAKNENDMGNLWYAERWLKSLRDRVGCKVNRTTTKEWSEEDEDIINKILCICDDFKRSFEISPASTKVVQNDIDKIDSWLKSLKERVQPQNTLKPSDEQMEAIKDAIEFLGCTKKVREDLKSLYGQLKKIREE